MVGPHRRPGRAAAPRRPLAERHHPPRRRRQAAASLGDRPGQASALTDLGDRAAADRRLSGRGADAWSEALGIFRDLGDRLGQANALNDLGAVRRLTGDYPGAARALEEALAICRDLGDRRGEANALYDLGTVRRMTGDYPGAARPWRRRWPSAVTSATGEVRLRHSTRQGPCTGSAAISQQPGPVTGKPWTWPAKSAVPGTQPMRWPAWPAAPWPQAASPTRRQAFGRRARSSSRSVQPRQAACPPNWTPSPPAQPRKDHELPAIPDRQPGTTTTTQPSNCGLKLTDIVDIWGL